MKELNFLFEDLVSLARLLSRTLHNQQFFTVKTSPDDIWHSAT